MVFRINKSKDYTCMSNFHLKDRKLSLKAKGLLSIMLSLPENWDYSINGLTAICIESRGVIRNTLGELKQNGYLKTTKLLPDQTETGRYRYIYDIYEEPKQDTEKQGIEKQDIEKQYIVFNKELNTNKLNTNKLNTNIIKEESTKQRFKPPTLEQIQDYIKEKKLNVDGEQFYNYFTSGDEKWVDSKGNKVRNWKGKLLTWNSYRQPKEKKTSNIKQSYGDLSKFYINKEEEE